MTTPTTTPMNGAAPHDSEVATIDIDLRPYAPPDTPPDVASPRPRSEVVAATMAKPFVSSGGRHKPRRQGGKPPTGLSRIRYNLGLTCRDLANKAGVQTGLIHKLEKGRLPINYPEGLLARLAEPYGLSVMQMRTYLDRKNVLPDHILHRVEQQAGVRRAAPQPGANRGGRPAKPKAAKGAKSATVKPNAGKALVHVKATASPAVYSGIVARGAYNKLKKMPKETRQLVRGLVSQFNIAAMKGDAYMDVAALPLEQWGAFLADYLAAKGITTSMLVAADFADHFDK